MVIGKVLGVLLRIMLPRRRKIVTANLAYCFPKLSQPCRQALMKKHFASLGASLLEVGLAWRESWVKSPGSAYVVEGLNYLREAQGAGRGVLLLTGHFVHPDLMGVFLSRYCDYHAMVRPQKSAFLNDFAEKKRSYAQSVLYQHEQLKCCRLLKKGHMVAYFADQDYGIKHSVFAPFFGRPAATVLATEKMASISNAVVLPAFFFRDTKNQTYRLVFMPMLSPFPCADALSSATAVNAVIEQAVRRYPEQYLWTHRRFKSRPEGESPIYFE